MYSCAVLTEHVSGCLSWKRTFVMVLLSEMVDFFFICDFKKADHLSNTEIHQYYRFQINSVHGQKVFRCCDIFLTYVQKMSQTKAAIFQSICSTQKCIENL